MIRAPADNGTQGEKYEQWQVMELVQIILASTANGSCSC